MYLHKTHRRRCACLAFTTLAVLSLAGCGPKKQAAAPAAPPQVTVVTVHRTTVPVTVELPGRTAAYFMAQVRARVDGIVLKRTFQEGADVKAGQLLYQIDPAPYRAMLNSAIATQQKMEATLAVNTTLAERYKVLVGGNAVSKQVYDNAVAAQQQSAADLAVAKAAVTTARINLGYTNVVSPITGRSGISQVTQGAFVQASVATLMNTVQQIDPIYVDLFQSSVEGLQLLRDVASGRIKLNGPNQAKVTLTQEDGTQYPLTGTLQFSGITVDPGTGSYPLRVIFRNPDHVLLPGMFVRARVDEGVNNAAFLVPQVGVTHNPQGQATALVVGPDNKVVLRTIQATRTIGDKWVVDGGLNDGERVIVAGTQKAPPGTLVSAVESQTPATPAPEKIATTTPVAPPSAPASQNAAASKSK
jgi:membrane fusion protein (multidrug efflux system)